MKNNTLLVEYLNNKSLYYDKIDFNVVNESWKILSKYLCLPYVIHIIGTNGKGSTGRFLASCLTQLDKNVLHYSSPHIVEFNERIWINGKNSTNNELDTAHSKLQKILPSKYLELLTYFEYTTLVALVLSDGLDYIVLEAGLGGEFDATNVVDNSLTLLTTIGLDHQDFLGDTIKDITLTKARSCNKSIIIGKQISQEVIGYIHELFKNNREVINIEDKIPYNTTSYENILPNYLLNNLSLAFCALEHLQLSLIDFKLPKLFGRYQKLTDNIIIDVGHNPLAAEVIAKQLKKEDRKIALIYNSYKDKDYTKVIEILKDSIERVYIIKCDDDRIVEKKLLQNVLSSFELPYMDFDIKLMQKDTNYLTFGSFLVVEEFLKQYNEC